MRSDHSRYQVRALPGGFLPGSDVRHGLPQVRLAGKRPPGSA